MADTSETQDLKKLKVPELKKLLKEKGLSFSGNKAELIARLQNEGGDGDAPLNDVEGEDVLNEEEEEEADDSVDPVLEEDLLTESTEKTDTKEAPKQAVEPPKPKIVKIEVKTDSQKLAARAERFGNVSEASKKQSRAERFGLPTTDTKNTSTTASAKSGKPAPLSATSTIDADKLKKRAERFGASVSSVYSQVESLDKMKKRAERFGQVTSTELSKVDSKEKLEKRKERFGAVITGPGSTDEQAKKKLRAERFGVGK